jgi:hypothetical protein
MLPEKYNKYYINIEPPVQTSEGETISQDIVLAKDEVKALEIMDKSYTFGPHKKKFKITEVVEVTLYQPNHIAVGEDYD